MVLTTLWWLLSCQASRCCKGDRYSCGASMITSWEVPHSNQKEIVVVLSFQAGARDGGGLFHDDGYMQELRVFGIKGPTQCSNLFGRPTLTLLRAAWAMSWNILISSIAYLHLEKLFIYIIMKHNIGVAKAIHRLIYSTDTADGFVGMVCFKAWLCLWNKFGFTNGAISTLLKKSCKSPSSPNMA